MFRGASWILSCSSSQRVERRYSRAYSKLELSSNQKPRGDAESEPVARELDELQLDQIEPVRRRREQSQLDIGMLSQNCVYFGSLVRIESSSMA